MLLDQDGWRRVYIERSALWIHDGDSRRPHALLSNGGHSDGFFNSQMVIDDPALTSKAVLDLFSLLKIRGFSLAEPDYVVGPAMGAITLAFAFAQHICNVRDPGCRYAYTEPRGEGGGKTMVFSKMTIPAGARVLLCEDVCTTGHSADMCAAAVTRNGGTVLTFLPVLVNRSGLTEVDGRLIVALIDHKMTNWNEGECPLCAAGSKALRPKESNNWELLNAEY